MRHALLAALLAALSTVARVSGQQVDVPLSVFPQAASPGGWAASQGKSIGGG